MGPATCVGGAHANAEYDGNADRTCEKDPGKSFRFLVPPWMSTVRCANAALSDKAAPAEG